MEIFIVALIVVFIIVIVSTVGSSTFPRNSGGFFCDDYDDEEIRRAGIIGEQKCTKMIINVLRCSDILFTNVSLTYDGKSAELDNVIVNEYGVFIIEVKNYSGELVGREDEREWVKYKTTNVGNTYEKVVKNPIKQVNREIYILAKYLEQRGSRIWVEGYAFLVQGNSPVKSERILLTSADIDRAIHTPRRNGLSAYQVNTIADILKRSK